jgi:hypothetical protein
VVISHQTVRLERGGHASPDRGMCVMELASVLAGEPFSDHPRAVCPVIASLLRTYNDRVDGERRQRLIPLAAEVVGTRASGDVQRLRAARCAAWAVERGVRLRSWQWRRRRLAAGRAPRLLGGGVLRWAGAAAGSRDDDAALALVRELVAIGPGLTVERVPAPDALEPTRTRSSMPVE